ncbi:MAG: spore coat protein, partial [Clostridia bacterium]|nr:spore coat protein [Clostridia bacterium]
MQNYKADITLNEKDSLQDMLTLEKSVVKLYSTAITE